ncbi:GAF domain-containing protein [Blastococcus saxobsidens]|uniref:GAF domain-containing protein n=1 Tax=Blastococcus saxobsidens TaxID=138336 RepID=A0A6L9W369_9ACTN|nr:GAF domain-containing protein [Blastococcus saxobsidens]
MPLGASSPTAGTAERVQFSAGEGPCTTSRAAGQPVLAAEEDLRRRWPRFAEQFLSRSPYRGVIALPLGPAPWGSGALDLYLTDGSAVAEVDVFTATAVGELVSAQLSDATIWSTWSPGDAPGWLRGPAARQRSRVWEALGRVCLDLDIPTEEALAVLRADAAARDRTVDEVAAELLAGDRAPADLAVRR